jgi:hypothetical protein
MSSPSPCAIEIGTGTGLSLASHRARPADEANRWETSTLRSRIVPSLPIQVSVLVMTSNQTVDAHRCMIPGTCLTHRGARIVPIVRVYQNGPAPTDNGAELDRATPTLAGA